MGFLLSKLILFDLDRTLIDVLQLHVEAFRTVFRRRYGIDASITDVEYAGVPYREIVKNLLRAKLPRNPSKKEVDWVSDELFEETGKIARSVRGVVVLPGVANLLDELRNAKNIYLGLLTGNTKEFTEMWLELSELSGYFPKETWSLGTEDWSDRAYGVAIAKKKCEGYYGTAFKRVVLVGDSDKEITASKNASKMLDIPVFVVSVATGHHPACVLKRLGADVVVQDFSDYRRVAKQIIHL